MPSRFAVAPFVAFLTAGAPAPVAPASAPVAIVCSSPRGVTTSGRGGPRAPLRLFERLLSGTELQAGPDANLIVAFVDGSRYELRGPGRARVEPARLAALEGAVIALPKLPSRLLVSTIQDRESTTGAAVVRVRGMRIRSLYPREHFASRAAATVLEFEAIPGIGRYEVLVRDDQGHTVLDSTTEGGRLEVPPGSLEPATRYTWSVRSAAAYGLPAHGEAVFKTLSVEHEVAREALLRTVVAAADASGYVLMAEIDRHLGLLAEARSDLEEAARLSPDESVREALEDLVRTINPRS